MRKDGAIWQRIEPIERGILFCFFFCVFLRILFWSERYIRTLILFGFVYDVDYSFLRQYNETLGKISGNLNQIAKRINSTGNVYEEDMAEVKAIMDEVWRTQKARLKKQPLIHNK